MDQPKPKRRGPIGFVKSHPVFAVLLLLSAIYFAAYFELVMPSLVRYADPAIPPRTVPSYAWRDQDPWEAEFVRWLFLPARRIDRITRTDAWKPPPPAPHATLEAASPGGVTSSPF